MALFEKKRNDTEKALKTLKEALESKPSAIARDAAIQRFEYTTEAVWKCLQVYLKEKEGIECYSPKMCMREAKAVGLLTEQETVLSLQMIDDRNMTSHTYHEEVAQKIFARLPEYAMIMEKLLQGMK